MRLLDKKTITDTRSAERKAEINEGLKLARKIDLLRRTASEEETKLTKFRETTLKNIRYEIIKLTDERDLLVEQVNHLIEEKDRLREKINQALEIN